MKCRDVVEFLEREVPLDGAESWDNPGFLVGDMEQEVRKILVVLDITNEVVEMAVKENVDFILAHHPVIFSKIQKCTSDDFLQKKLLTLIRNDICCYGMHTNYDVYRMCDAVGRRLSLTADAPVEISSNPALASDNKGIGFISTFKEKKSLQEFAKKVKNDFGLDSVMIYGDPQQQIEKVAVVPGSGKSLMKEAMEKEADVLITGDFGHHEGLDAVDMGLTVIDAGHYGLEQVFIDDMEELLKKKLPECEIISLKAGSPFKVII